MYKKNMKPKKELFWIPHAKIIISFIFLGVFLIYSLTMAMLEFMSVMAEK